MLAVYSACIWTSKQTTEKIALLILKVLNLQVYDKKLSWSVAGVT